MCIVKWAVYSLVAPKSGPNRDLSLYRDRESRETTRTPSQYSAFNRYERVVNICVYYIVPDDYRRGYVSFANCFLYIITATSATLTTAALLTTATASILLQLQLQNR